MWTPKSRCASIVTRIAISRRLKEAQCAKLRHNMSMADIVLKVPADRTSCAAWLRVQDPPVVADALSLCEAAFSAVRRDVSEGEVARIEQLHTLQVKQLREKFERERAVLSEEVRIAKESADSLANEIDRRHSDSQEVLRGKLRQVQEESARALQQASDLYRQKLSTLESRLAEHDSILDAAQAAKRDAVNEAIAKERSRAESDRARSDLILQKDLESLRNELASRAALDAQMLSDEQARHAKDVEELREHQRKGFFEQEQRFSEQEARLVAARTSKEAAVEEALEKQRSRLEAEASQREQNLQRQVGTLRQDLEAMKGVEAQALLAEKLRQEAHQQAKEEQHRKDLEALREQHLITEGFLRADIAKRDADIANATTQVAALVREGAADRERLEHLVQQQSDAMARYSGVASRGQLGERTVAEVFAGLQLGEYTDESGHPEDGCADGLWVYQPSAHVPRLSAIVEVKDVRSLHSQKDIGKFQRDLLAGVESNRANAGLFLSLGCRYAGKPPLQLVIEHGIPVCYASRAVDDALPVKCMIELAVRSLAEAWPLICRQRGEGVQMTVAAAAEQFEELLQNCENFSKHILKISKAAKTQLAEANHLEKIRDQMVKGIEGVRVNHPSLVPEVLEEEEEVATEGAPDAISTDRWATIGGQLFLSAFRAGKRGRVYPKAATDLKLDVGAIEFLQNNPDAFTAAKEVLQRESRSAVRGEKRKATASVLNPADVDDDEPS